jgi:hypothetical protein
VQTQRVPDTVGLAFGPQGLGWHGSTLSVGFRVPVEIDVMGWFVFFIGLFICFSEDGALKF